MNTFVFNLTVMAKTISNVNNVYIIQISFKLSECWIEIFISYKILIRRMIPHQLKLVSIPLSYYYKIINDLKRTLKNNQLIL